MKAFAVFLCYLVEDALHINGQIQDDFNLWRLRCLVRFVHSRKIPVRYSQRLYPKFRGRCQRLVCFVMLQTFAACDITRALPERITRACLLRVGSTWLCSFVVTGSLYRLLKPASSPFLQFVHFFCSFFWCGWEKRVEWGCD